MLTVDIYFNYEYIRKLNSNLKKYYANYKLEPFEKIS